MLVNFSNHPSSLWSEEQLAAAHEYGAIIDIPFPSVSPEASEDEIADMADTWTSAILLELSIERKASLPVAVHIMGEMTLTYAIIQKLLAEGITCVASTTQREVTFDENGNKIATFKFVKFRKYQ